MPIEIEGPDGKVHTFPTGTPMEQVQAQIARVYGGSQSRGLPQAGANTPTTGSMQPSSQTTPPYFQEEDEQNLMMAKILGGPKAVSDAIQRTPGHQYRVTQATEVAKNQAAVEAAQRTGTNILKSYAQLYNKFNKIPDDVLQNAIGSRNTVPYSQYTPLIGGMTRPEAAAAYPFMPYPNASGWGIPGFNGKDADDAWNAQNLLSHDVHGITNAFMSGAGKSLNMSDKRQEVFESAMKDFMKATNRKSAKEILDHAKGIIANDFGIPTWKANEIVEEHIKEIEREKTREKYTQDQAIQEAKKAIAAGKNKNAVIQRMRELGYDTSGLQ